MTQQPYFGRNLSLETKVLHVKYSQKRVFTEALFVVAKKKKNQQLNRIQLLKRMGNTSVDLEGCSGCPVG